MAGENEMSIGAARAYLDIDATGWDTAIARAKSGAAGLGTVAEQAYDQATAAQKRATDGLLRYMTATTGVMDQQKILVALMKGMPVDVGNAAAVAMAKHNQAIEAATVSQKELNDQLAKQAVIETELARQQAAIDSERAKQNAQNAQLSYNQLLGVNDASSTAGRRSDAEAAFSTLPTEQEAQAAAMAEAAAAAQAEAKALDELAASLIARDVAAAESVNVIRGEAYAMDQETASVERLAAAQVKANTATAESSAAAAQATAAQTAEVSKLAGQIDPVTRKLNALDAQQTKLNSLRDKGLIGADDFAAYNQVIEDQRVKVTAAAEAMSKLNFNTAAARREYGFMIKDVATGQWGRFEQSTATLANNIGGLGVGFLAFAGVLALVTAGIVNAAHEWDGFVTAIAKGDSLSGTVKQLDDMAKALGGQEGNTLGNARDAIEGLAQAGLLSGQNFEMAAKAATDWASTTGESADKVTDKFNEIAKDPLKAIADGTVRVTEAQYELITGLERAGDQQGAVNALVKIYFDEIESRSDMVKNNLSGFTSLWHDIRDSLKGAKDGAVDFFDTVALGISKGKAPRSDDWGYLGQFLGGGIKNNFYAMGKQVREQQEAAGQQSTAGQFQWNDGTNNLAGPPTLLTQQQITLQTALQKAYDDSGTAAEKYSKSVQVLNGQLSGANTQFLQSLNISKNADGTFGGAGYDQMLTTLKKRSGLDGNQRTGMTQENAAIKADAAAQIAQIQQTTTFIQGQYQLRQISVDDYYTELKSLAQQTSQVQIDAIDKEIAADKAHGATQDQINTLLSQRKKLVEDEAKTEQQLDVQRAVAAKTQADALRAFNEAQDQQTLALKRQLDTMVQRVGMGQQEYEIESKKNDIYNQQADALTKLAQAQARDPNAVDYEAERNKILDETVVKINAVTDAYGQLNAKQLDVTNGMKAAWSDFSQKSMNLSDNFQSVWSDALGALGEKAAYAATGIGTSFTDLAKQIEATAIKTLTNAAVSQFIKLIAGMFGIGAGGGATGMGDALNGGSSYTGAGSLGTTWGGYGGATFNAKGGMYDSPSLSALSGRVLDKPTPFMFAKGGALGIAGEAGNEAIMPVARDSNGIMGVRSYGGGAAMGPININFKNAPSGTKATAQKNDQGGFDVSVMFDQIDTYMAGGIMGNTSKTSRAIAQTTGARR